MLALQRHLIFTEAYQNRLGTQADITYQSSSVVQTISLAFTTTT
jgi:hypothetical protein